MHDTLALRALLARQDAVRIADAVKACVRDAESAVNAVGGLAGDLVAAAGGNGSGPRNRIREQVYALLDSPFRAWLLTVRPSEDGADPDVDLLRTTWHETVADTVRRAARELLVDIPPACWEGRRVGPQEGFTAAHAEAKFRKALREAVPGAFRTDVDENEAA